MRKGNLKKNPPAAEETGDGVFNSDSLIRTADRLIPLERILDGGLPFGTMSLIEGSAAAGNTVLCMHFAFGALMGNQKVPFCTTTYTANSLGEQMASLGMDVSEYLQDERLKVYPLQEPPPGEDPAHFVVELDLAMEGASP